MQLLFQVRHQTPRTTQTVVSEISQGSGINTKLPWIKLL